MLETESGLTTTPLKQELVSTPRHYRYYDLVMAAFVTVLLCSNVIGAAKVAQVLFWLPT